MKRSWPDLAYRVRRAEKKEKEKDASPGKDPQRSQDASRPKEQEFGDVFIALLSKVVAENARDSGMTEDQYVAHLKDCATCRRNVATLARMGMKIPSRILVAAGVEVLN